MERTNGTHRGEGTMSNRRMAPASVLFGVLLLIGSFLCSCGGGSGGNGNGDERGSGSACGEAKPSNSEKETNSTCGDSSGAIVDVEVTADGRCYYIYPVDGNGVRGEPQQAAKVGDLKRLLETHKTKQATIRRVRLRVSANYNELSVDELRQQIETLGLTVSMISDEGD